MKNVFYIVYKTTNLLNGHFYIGVRRASDLKDGYLGSGVLLRKAVKKYGREHFCREILFVFDNEEEMWQKEAELVTETLVASPDCYNAHVGGNGGWSHTNATRRQRGIQLYHAQAMKKRREQYATSPCTCAVCGKALEWERRKSTYCSRWCANNSVVTRARGWKYYSDEAKAKMRQNLQRGYSKQSRQKMKKTQQKRSQIKYSLAPKKCLMCGRCLAYEERHRKTCSTECLYAFRRQPMAKRSRKGIRE